MSFRRQPRPAPSLSQPRAASSLTTPTPPPQVEHHLFPRLPRHNLRIARDMVKEVVEKHFPAGSPECKRLFPLGVAYHEPGFFEARSRPARGAPCRAHAPRPPLPSPRPLPASTAQRNRPLPFPANRHRARSHVHSHAACAVVAGQPRDVAHAQAGGVRGARRQEGRARLLGERARRRPQHFRLKRRRFSREGRRCTTLKSDPLTLTNSSPRRGP